MTFPPERQIDSHSHAHKGLSAAMCFFTKQQMLFFRPHLPDLVRSLHICPSTTRAHESAPTSSHLGQQKRSQPVRLVRSSIYTLPPQSHPIAIGRYCFIGRKPCRQSNQEHSLYPPRPEATTRLSSPASRAHTTRLNTTPTGKSGGLTRPLHRNPARMALLVLKPTSLSPSSEDLLCQSKSTRVSSSLTLTTCLQKTSQTSRSSSER